jgi:hypothetical protein
MAIEIEDQDWPYLNKYKKENAVLDTTQTAKTELFYG